MNKTTFKAPGRYGDLPGMVRTFDASKPLGLSAGHDLHIDNYLTNVAINYTPQEMIADPSVTGIAPSMPHCH